MGAVTGQGSLIGVPELRALTGLDRDTIVYHLEAGHWPGVAVGKRRVWRIPRRVADALLAGEDPASIRRPTPAA